MGWLDAIPPETLLENGALTTVIYPNDSLLNNHALRLRLTGLADENVAILTSEMPPNAERATWERIGRDRVALLLISARKLQSITTLSQLIQQPRLGPIFVEQAHLALPYLWGPQSATPATTPYTKLVALFREQWTSHPPLMLFSGPMPAQYTAALQSTFMLSTPQHLDWQLPIPQLRMTIEACFTGHQKFQRLLRFLGSETPGPISAYPAAQSTASVSVVACANRKQVLDLERRLLNRNPIVIHRQLAPEEKELRLMEPLHEREALIIIERDMLAELPLPLFFLDTLKIIHWQLPWSCEALAQQVLLATRQSETPIEALVLYTKEDYTTQKEVLAYHYAQYPSAKGIARDHLTRVRHATVRQAECRRVQVENWLAGYQPRREPCHCCDRCQDPPASSLWRKCLNTFLY